MGPALGSSYCKCCTLSPSTLWRLTFVIRLRPSLMLWTKIDGGLRQQLVGAIPVLRFELTHSNSGEEKDKMEMRRRVLLYSRPKAISHVISSGLTSPMIIC